MWSIGHQRTVSTSRDSVLLLLVNPMWRRLPSSLARLLFSRCSLVCLYSFVLEDSTGELFLRCCLFFPQHVSYTGFVQWRQTLANRTLTLHLHGGRQLFVTTGGALWTQQRSSGVCYKKEEVSYPCPSPSFEQDCSRFLVHCFPQFHITHFIVPSYSQESFFQWSVYKYLDFVGQCRCRFPSFWAIQQKLLHIWVE